MGSPVENAFFKRKVLPRAEEFVFFCLTICLFIVSSFVFTSKVFAANEASQTFTLDGTLTQAGTKSALIDSNAKLTIGILSPDGTCLLYEETQNVNTTSTSGYFSIQVGSQTGVGKRTVNDPGNTMAKIFQNTAAISANNVPSHTCAAGTYTPAAGDIRYFRIIVTPSATLAADTLSPDIIIDSVPQALVAQSLQGLDRSSILQVNNSGSTILTQANLEAAFTTPAYVNLQAILAGNFLSKDSTGAALPVFAANPGGVAAGDLWYDSTLNQVKYYNGTAVQTLGTAGAGISSLTVGSSMSADGTVGGTLSAAGTIDLSNTGVTAGAYPKVTVDAKGRVTAGTTLSESDIPTLSTAGKVSGNAITSGTISGSTSINSSGNLVTTGSVSGLTVQATNLRIYNGAEYAQLTASAMSGNIGFTWPATTGSSGQVLSTDGNGILSWITSGLPSLLDGKIWLGNGSNVATAVTMSGDATISNAGVLTLNTVPVTKGGTGATSMAANRIVSSNGTGSAYQAFTCSLNQVISFDGSGNATCANVSELAGMILNGGNTTAGTISIGTNDNQPFQFKTNNTVAMTISQSGNVGIGTAVPAATLSVKPAAAGDVLQILNTSGAIAANFSVAGGGHGRLQVKDGGAITRFDLDAGGGNLLLKNTGGNTYVSLASDGTSSYISGTLAIGTASPGTSILHTVASGPKTSAYIGNYLTNTSTSSTASILKTGLDVQSTGTWNGASAVNTGLNVNVSGGTTNYAATFQGGNVGVGTTAPVAVLDVRGSSSFNQGDTTKGTLAVRQRGTTNSDGIYLENPGASASIRLYLDGSGVQRLDNMSDGSGLISLNGAGTGKVGIGVISPTARLEVQGQVRAVASTGGAKINASAAIDWNNGNAQSMSVDCATTTFTNMLDGGSYILAVSETGTSTCTFSQAGLTFYFSPVNGARTSGQRTIYSFQRIGTDVYVSWVAGFQ